MAPGQNHRIVLSDNANGEVAADAVQVTRVGAPPSTATWLPSLPRADTYQVYERTPGYGTWTSTAPFTVFHQAGSTTTLESEVTGGGTWKLLGIYDLYPGQNHRAYADWTHERMRRQAQATGPATAALIETIMRACKHPEQGFRSCVGILRLAKSYGADRLEAACERALAIGARSYTSLASILKSGLDRKPRPPAKSGDPTAEPAPESAADRPIADHPNIRGPRYYH